MTALQSSYIAAIFDSQERALAFHKALSGLRQVDLKIHRAGVYGYDDLGDIALVDEETCPDALFELLTGSSSAEVEAIDELREKLPAGSFALLAHVSESDASTLDALAREYDGRVYRRQTENLESTGLRRFTDASNL